MGYKSFALGRRPTGKAAMKLYRVGKTRIKLAALLECELRQVCEDETIRVAPEDLHSQPTGGSIFCDWATWSGFAYTGAGAAIGLHSWYTMTECCRKGIVVERESGLEIQVFAQETL